MLEKSGEVKSQRGVKRERGIEGNERPEIKSSEEGNKNKKGK